MKTKFIEGLAILLMLIGIGMTISGGEEIIGAGICIWGWIIYGISDIEKIGAP